MKLRLKTNEQKNDKKKNPKRQASGITLIALIVTIIVLLILAGVTIATLTGENRNIKPSTKCEKG